MLPPPPIQLLFCRTDRALSKLIMWGFDEPASHLAIDLPELADVLHSDLLGLHAAPRGDFLRAHQVVASFALRLEAPARARVGALLEEWVRGKAAPYDFGAFAYLAGRVVLAKLWGPAVPRANPWGDADAFICTEAAELLNEAVVETTGQKLFDYGEDLGAMTPWQLRSLLLKTWGGRDEACFLSARAGA